MAKIFLRHFVDMFPKQAFPLDLNWPKPTCPFEMVLLGRCQGLQGVETTLGESQRITTQPISTRYLESKA